MASALLKQSQALSNSLPRTNKLKARSANNRGTCQRPGNTERALESSSAVKAQPPGTYWDLYWAERNMKTLSFRLNLFFRTAILPLLPGRIDNPVMPVGWPLHSANHTAQLTLWGCRPCRPMSKCRNSWKQRVKAKWISWNPSNHPDLSIKRLIDEQVETQSPGFQC